MSKKGGQRKRGEMIDPTLLSATAHPVRAYCLSALFERTASPRELADELDLPIQNVAYHVKELSRLGCIELVRTEKKRATEHFYRATNRHMVNVKEWVEIDPEERAKITGSLLRLIGNDINAAMAHGTIDDDDNHISRSPMTVDREGWGEVVTELEETLCRLFAIQERSAKRRASPDSDPDDSIPIKIEILQFRSPSRA